MKRAPVELKKCFLSQMLPVSSTPPRADFNGTGFPNVVDGRWRSALIAVLLGSRGE